MDKSSLGDFASPIATPTSPEQRSRWQEANRTWWENNPMQYDWRDGLEHEKFSEAYYREIDARFFSSTRSIMPWQSIPFDNLIPFAHLQDKKCLEIGVGCGTHAQLIAQHAGEFTGIDLTEHAVHCTRSRMELSGIRAQILRMDAEEMTFPDQSFDFVWSWGVIHHSADTPKVLSEIHRVLKPGGKAHIMVYYRNYWNYYIIAGLFFGILKGNLFRTGSLTKTQQLATDGALARYYTIPEWRALVEPGFAVDEVQIFGLKPEILPMPAGRAKNFLLAVIPDALARFFVHRCKMGSFLVSKLTRR
ncbi:MAG: class I SAM-dependent methyltransferase [Magnetococcales bacterium]|nr:class I SAM-dependent methyltransferase [Magnetococcales bacterium]MBF0322968.1 class I SAM-dependent methyltransferase [Magnetococcales bacterium]